MLWVSVVSSFKGTAGAAHPSVNADFQVWQRWDVNFEKQAPLNFSGVGLFTTLSLPTLVFACFRSLSYIEKLGGVCEPDIC